jgi:hypothetical protein
VGADGLMALITDTWLLVDMVAERFAARSGPLGISYVGTYNEKIIPKYPAVIIVPGGKSKTLHATHTFQTVSTLFLYIYHANLTLTKRERSKADLQLVALVEAELESDMGWQENGNGTRRIIQGWVEEEEPGVLQPRASKGDAVICTRLTWRCISQRRFTSGN